MQWCFPCGLWGVCDEELNEQYNRGAATDVHPGHRSGLQWPGYIGHSTHRFNRGFLWSDTECSGIHVWKYLGSISQGFFSLFRFYLIFFFIGIFRMFQWKWKRGKKKLDSLIWFPYNIHDFRVSTFHAIGIIIFEKKYPTFRKGNHNSHSHYFLCLNSKPVEMSSPKVYFTWIVKYSEIPFPLTVTIRLDRHWSCWYSVPSWAMTLLSGSHQSQEYSEARVMNWMLLINIRWLTDNASGLVVYTSCFVNSVWSLSFDDVLNRYSVHLFEIKMLDNIVKSWSYSLTQCCVFWWFETWRMTRMVVQLSCLLSCQNNRYTGNAILIFFKKICVSFPQLSAETTTFGRLNIPEGLTDRGPEGSLLHLCLKNGDDGEWIHMGVNQLISLQLTTPVGWRFLPRITSVFRRFVSAASDVILENRPG